MRNVAATALPLFALASIIAAETNVTKAEFKPTNIKGAFIEQFTDDWAERWTPSEATKKTPVGGETFSYVGQWEVEESNVLHAINGDKGLVVKSKAAHHAISAPFAKTVDPKGKTLVIQYEAKFQKGGNCGGGYIKLLEDGFQTSAKEFSDQTPWVVMFGPDLTCPGTKVHFIFRHQNPVTKEFEEKHLKKAPVPTITEETSLYTLIVNPDNSYEILINDESFSKGNLLEDFEPSVNPSKEIDDPEDKKPADWVDEAKIADPNATKPAEWDEDAPYEVLDEEAEKPEGWLDDEPLHIADPDAEKPEEWVDEEDGDWLPPTVANPKCAEAPGCGPWTRPNKANPEYKGKWSAPLIDNPAYKGLWAPRKIPNPAYFEDLHPANLNKMGGIGIELWTMTEDILFDNIYVGHSPADAKALAKESFRVKSAIEKAIKAEQDKVEDDTSADSSEVSLLANPTEFIRKKIFTFIDLAKEDPVTAFKAMPETAGALITVLLTFFGMLGALFGLIGGAQKPIAKPTKKTDAPTADDKLTATADAAPVAPAGAPTKEKGTPAKKRAGK
jgi:hypothetical protein